MQGTSRPNIILALFDALSAQALDEILTELPAFQTLNATSTVYKNAYTPGAESGPACASLFTGLDPGVHGVWTDGVALPDDEQTFVQRLAQSGYSTALCGRRHLSGLSHWTTEPMRPYEYSRCEWAHGPLHRSRQNAYLKWLQEVTPETYSKLFPLQANPDNTAIPPEQYQAMSAIDDEFSFNHWVGLRTGRTITDHPPNHPFLCIAGFVVGATMGAEPEKSICGDALNDQALQQADAALSHITSCLSAAKCDDNTVIIICAARGNANNNGSAQPLMENQIKVPLVVYQPGGTGAVIEPPVSTIDLAPTVLELAQLPLPARLQGSSLLADKSPRGWALSRLRSEHSGWHSALRMDHSKLVVSHGSTQPNHPPAYRLYDLSVDPLEINNLASNERHADALEGMIDKLIDARCALEDRTEPRIAKF